MQSESIIYSMKNYNFSPISCWQPPNPGEYQDGYFLKVKNYVLAEHEGLDEFHSSNPTDISMMVGSNLNCYLGAGFDDNSSHQLCYGSSIDCPPQLSYFSPAIQSSLMLSTPTESISIGAPPSLLDYQWILPCETPKSDSLYVQSCKPTLKEVRKSVNGAKLGQRNSGLRNFTSLEASRTCKKREAMEQSIHAKKLKAPGRKSQKLTDKIAALQEIVSPYGKTDTASVLQEACLYIKIVQQEIRRLSISYLDGRPFRGFRAHIQDDMEQCDLQSRGLCLVPISIMKRLTTETWSDQHQIASRNVRRP